MMPGSSTSASTRCAGCTRNGWCTNWTPSPTASRRPDAGARPDLGLLRRLKAYRVNPKPPPGGRVARSSIASSCRRTGFVTLDRLLKRLHANKAELLMVLDRPETPLHTNGSENDIRC
jgi:hypothetical protein